jgi:lipopolysaccharide transport system ATP-binding protein
VTVVASLRDVTKVYRLGTERSNWRALIPGSRGEPTGGAVFHALDDVSVDIHAGRSIGVVGINGAGKSTLLKVLAGVVQPTTGTVQVAGRVAAAIELGVGFNPDLTGTENLDFAAALFGVSSADVARKRDEIVDFAGVGDFMDMPLKRYSTGMRARLGFALVTSFEADLVLLDEVLSVGDWAFQQRCIERVRTLHAAGAAIVAVSHSNWLIAQICDHALLLEDGRVVFEGDPLGVVERYLGEETVTDTTKDENFATLDLLREASDAPVRLSGLVLDPPAIESNDHLHVRFRLEVLEPVEAELVLSLYTMGRAIFADPDIGPSEVLRRPGVYELDVVTDRLPFSPGSFRVRVAVLETLDPEDHLHEHRSALTSATGTFKVLGEPSTRPGLQFETSWNAVEIEVEPRSGPPSHHGP